MSRQAKPSPLHYPPTPAIYTEYDIHEYGINCLIGWFRLAFLVVEINPILAKPRTDDQC